MEIKLFVDDVRRCPDGWTVARTITEAIRALSLFDVSEVSLDHDIGHEVRDLETNKMKFFSCTETFEPVAWYIRQMRVINQEKYWASQNGKTCGQLLEDNPHYEPKPIVTIHSSNPAGAQKLCNILGLDYATCYRPYSVVTMSEEGIKEHDLEIKKCLKCNKNMTLWPTISGSRWLCDCENQ